MIPRVIQTPPSWTALENIVITGGSGAIGLRYARYCVEHGAQRVILLSRNGLDPAVLRELTEGHSAEVHAPRCDVTDRGALAAVAAEYGGSGASLLIHTAGIAVNRQHSELTGADLAAVCAAKVAGLALMADVWPLRDRMPNPGLLLSVRSVGRPRSCRLRGVQPAA